MINNFCTYHDSAFVWVQWEILTSLWPWQAKAAKINVLWVLGWVLLKAALTVSCPKHFMVWLFRLDVAVRSLESWKRQMPWTPFRPWHFFAAQWKKWYLRLPAYPTVTSGLKKPYTAECHPLLSRSAERIQCENNAEVPPVSKYILSSVPSLFSSLSAPSFASSSPTPLSMTELGSTVG